MSASDRFLETRFGQVVQVVHAALADDGIERALGRAALHAFRGKRRLCWVLNPGKIEYPPARGRRFVQSGASKVTQRVLNNRLESVSVHITDDGEAATEAQLDRVIALLRMHCGASIVVQGYEWLTEKPKEAGETNWTPHIRLDFVLKLPVYTTASATVRPTAHEHTLEFGGEDTDC